MMNNEKSRITNSENKENDENNGTPQSQNNWNIVNSFWNNDRKQKKKRKLENEEWKGKEKNK